MEIKPLKLAGTYEVILDPKNDDRGYFMRTFDDAIFNAFGLVTLWSQENQALSGRKGVIRGLHFQAPPHSETKLLRAVQGAVYDVFVDIRKDSKSYGQWDAVTIAAESNNMVYIPKGFAHGYCVLADETIVLYKVDTPYAPESEGGIRWDDKTLNIPWPVKEPHLSAKDRALPSFGDFISPF